MSFILDALRKSENDRQRQASPTVSVTAAGPQRRWQPGWIALALTGIGAALLAVTIVWWFFAPAPAPTANVTVNSDAAPNNNTTVKAEAGVRSLAQEARRNNAADVVEPTLKTALQDAASPPPKPEPKPRGDVPLTVTEAMASGLSLPHLNLDIHVFAPQPNERFVFINARKYREREQLREGPTVTEITSDGVILEFQGQRLLLPRD